MCKHNRSGQRKGKVQFVHKCAVVAEKIVYRTANDKTKLTFKNRKNSVFQSINGSFTLEVHQTKANHKKVGSGRV